MLNSTARRKRDTDSFLGDELRHPPADHLATRRVLAARSALLHRRRSLQPRDVRLSSDRAESVSYRAVTPGGVMAGFVIGLVEPDHTGHVTTVGVAPEHRRRNIAKRLMFQVEEGFRKRNVRLVRLEVRTLNVAAQKLYESLGYDYSETAEVLFQWR